MKCSKSLHLALAFCLFVPHLLQAQEFGVLRGRVTDATTGEPLLGANVVIADTRFGAATDSKGEYLIDKVPPGIYDVRVSFVGYESILATGFQVEPVTTLDVSLSEDDAPVDGKVVEFSLSPPSRRLSVSFGPCLVHESQEKCGWSQVSVGLHRFFTWGRSGGDNLLRFRPVWAPTPARGGGKKADGGAGASADHLWANTWPNPDTLVILATEAASKRAQVSETADIEIAGTSTFTVDFLLRIGLWKGVILEPFFSPGVFWVWESEPDGDRSFGLESQGGSMLAAGATLEFPFEVKGEYASFRLQLKQMVFFPGLMKYRIDGKTVALDVGNVSKLSLLFSVGWRF